MNLGDLLRRAHLVVEGIVSAEHEASKDVAIQTWERVADHIDRLALEVRERKLTRMGAAD